MQESERSTNNESSDMSPSKCEGNDYYSSSGGVGAMSPVNTPGGGETNGDSTSEKD
jgi:hypothetical protein